MSANEEWELVVSLSPEGAEETTEALDETRATFEETADTADESATQLDGFSRKWAGAMGVIVGALATATAGLLSRVPVVSDLMDGLMAVVDSLAFYLDSELRPAIGPVVDSLFNLSTWIDKNHKTMDSFMGLIEDVTGPVTGLKTGVDDLKRMFSALAPHVGMGDLEEDFDRGIEIISGFVTSIPEKLSTMREDAQKKIGNLGSDVITGIQDFVGKGVGEILAFGDRVAAGWERLKITATSLWSEMWVRIQQEVIKGANGALSRVESMVNRAIRAYNNLPLTPDVSTVSVGRLSADGLSNRLATIQSNREDQLAAVTRAEERAVNASREQGENMFAENQEVTVQFEPQSFRQFLESEVNQGTANRRGGGRGVR